jgi:hypothetical protein
MIGVGVFITTAVLFALITTGLDFSYPGGVWYGILPLAFKMGGGAPIAFKAALSGLVILTLLLCRLLIAIAIGGLIGLIVYWTLAFLGKMFTRVDEPGVNTVTGLSPAAFSGPKIPADPNPPGVPSSRTF